MMPVIKTVQEGCKAAAAVYVTTIQPNTGHLGSETIRGLVTDCSMRSLVQRGRHRIPGSKVAQSHKGYSSATRAATDKTGVRNTVSRFFKNIPRFKKRRARPSRKLGGTRPHTSETLS